MMRTRHGGFTLIEIIGVLAIMAILASVLIPNIGKEISRSIADAEDRDLEALARSLTASIQETRVFPGTPPAQWSNAIAPYLTIPASKITTNRGTGDRRLFIDPANGLYNAPNPYVQTAAFNAVGNPYYGRLPTALPLQARFLLISNLTIPVPAGINNIVPFNNTWNQNALIPNGFTENEKLRIARINVSPMFSPVFVECQTVTGVPQWEIDGATRRALALGPPFTVYLLAGTRINLYQNATLVTSLVVGNGKMVSIRYKTPTATWTWDWSS